MKNLVSVKIGRLIESAKLGNLAEAEVLAKELLGGNPSTIVKSLVDKIVSNYGLNIGRIFDSTGEIVTLSSIDKKPILNGVSIVSCCMNRNDNLKKAVKTWTALNVDEIIIVDWSSTTPVADTLSELNDSRIKIVRVEGEEKWILTNAFNVGLRFARYSKIYKFDADIEVGVDFVNANYFNDTEYVRGNWATAVESGREDQKFVNGSFGAPKEALKSIGYYNENIQTYGWDDSDIYQRLSLSANLKAKFVEQDSMLHLEQDQEERLKHQSVNKHLFLGRFEATEFYNIRNKYITSLKDDWSSNLLSEFELEYIGERNWVAKRTTPLIQIPGHIIADAEKYAVLKLASWANHYIYSMLTEKPQLTGLVIDHFNNNISVELTTHVLELMSGTKKVESITADDPNVDSVIFLKGLETVLCAEHNNRELLVQPSLVNEIELDSSTFTAKFKNKSVFITSLFDESNEKRLAEYLYCVTENIKHFDFVAILYEETSGTLLTKIRALLDDDVFNEKLVIIKYSKRPTFEFIFDLADVMFRDAIVYISNADIVVDNTIKKIPAYIDNEKFFVLSRNEADTETKTSKGLILNSLGVANTFSADMWVYQAPRKYNFKSDFGIGTFHCDSFLNYFISESGYKLYNPCLSVNIYHIHDPEFNSSETKAKIQKDEINKRLVEETKLNNGTPPICGSRWSDLEITSELPINGGRVYWTDAVLIVPISRLNLFKVIVLVQYSLFYMRAEGFYYSIWLEISDTDRNTEFLQHVNHLVASLGSDMVNVTIEDTNDSPLVETRISSVIDTKYFLNKVNSLSEKKDFEEMFYGGDRKGTIYLKSDVEDYPLYRVLRTCDKSILIDTKSVLERLGESNFLPHVEDLNKYIETDKRFDELIQRKNLDSPDITFITSIFKGEEFMRGFLSNIAAAAIESNGHVILLDAKSPQQEELVYSEFIKEHPELTHYFTYIRLEKDPGLYNCWKRGIEMSKSKYVSNANLDDRRSPFQAMALIKKLNQNPGYRGAASGMRANTNKNVSYYSVCEDQYWFNKGYDQTISFDSLYFKDENGLILSHNIMHCMPVWEKELHDQYGFFDEERYGTSADWAFWLKCTKAGEEFLLVESVLSQYFINENSHNRTNDANGEKENLIVLDNFQVSQAEFIQQ